MKKYLALVLVAVMLLSLVACGSERDEEIDLKDRVSNATLAGYEECGSVDKNISNYIEAAKKEIEEEGDADFFSAYYAWEEGWVGEYTPSTDIDSLETRIPVTLILTVSMVDGPDTINQKTYIYLEYDEDENAFYENIGVNILETDDGVEKMPFTREDVRYFLTEQIATN